jgi:D-alanyl-lipoteichoic acid acyltransferase DltB (MBOAT superfamily)
MSWDWRFGFLMLFSTTLDFFVGILIGKFDREEPRARKFKNLLMVTSIIINLGVLGYFKYVDFFISSFVDLANSISPGTYSGSEKNSLLLNVILPLGISFFTFQSMSYTIDVYRRIVPVEKSFIKFALFVAFFPQLVAGPIVMAKDFLPQLSKDPVFNAKDMLKAARWFLLGYIKKAAIADNISVVVDQIYAKPESFGTFAHWMGAAAFCIQIYCDFSGYSDMAWGTAIALGYRLPENFNMPYKSTSMTEFWQRWHISLIKWIRDYLYIPLGGNRVSALRHKFNIFITMFLAGLWHGANWTFVFWGATQGLVMAIENIIKLALGITNDNKSKFKIYNYLNNNTVFRFSTIVIMFSYTMCLTMISAAIFRSNTIHDFFVIFTRLFALDSFPKEIPQISLYRPVIMGILALVIGHTIGNYIFEKKTFRWNVHPAYEITLIPVLILILTQIVANDVAAFVYFVF